MAKAPQQRIVKLPQEMKQRLTDSKADIDLAEKEIEVLAELGMDVTDLTEKVEWAKRLQTTLLKHYG